ncbi:MAG: hypothetical protein GF350_17225 [Chitinivibrionales bacterium]|nr:hypothetical protein [Chitinivibrionales bacterium]
MANNLRMFSMIFMQLLVLGGQMWTYSEGDSINCEMMFIKVEPSQEVLNNINQIPPEDSLIRYEAAWQYDPQQILNKLISVDSIMHRVGYYSKGTDTWWDSTGATLAECISFPLFNGEIVKVYVRSLRRYSDTYYGVSGGIYGIRQSTITLSLKDEKLGGQIDISGKKLITYSSMQGNQIALFQWK